MGRENSEIFFLQMSAVVKYKNGSIAEDNIVMRIEVIDQNDNPPIFDVLPPGNVTEGSPPGMYIFIVYPNSWCSVVINMWYN